MKKLKTILKIAAVLLFAAVFTLFCLSAAGIYKSRKVVEDVLGSKISYFSDQSILSRDYYKYKDESGVEYWVDSSSGKLVYLFDKSASQLDTSISQNAALDIAYEAAQKWGYDFFSLNTTWTAEDGEYYTFYILQLDDANNKTGKFIEVSVKSDQVESIAVHANAGKADKFMPLISETKAVAAAYSQTESTEFALYQKDNHLVKPLVYKSGETWVWDISIWEITSAEIKSQSAAINEDVFYNCQINAVTGETISSRWITQATDYCPLTGEILNGD